MKTSGKPEKHQQSWKTSVKPEKQLEFEKNCQKLPGKTFDHLFFFLSVFGS